MRTLIDTINSASQLQGGEYDPDELCLTAVELAAHIKAAQGALEPLKRLLRDLAASDYPDEAHVHYDTVQGTVSITRPAPRYKIKGSVDWGGLRDRLGDLFDVYFTTSTKHELRGDIEQIIATRQASDEVPAILNIVQRDEPTPRVGFKPTGG